MALDIYVMPIWRFKVGDFCSPIETATGIRPKIVTADGIVQRPTRAGWIARWRARRQVHAIRTSVEAANGARVRWNDEGAAVYSRQSCGFESLRAYATWLDCRDRFGQFDPPPEGNYDKHPNWPVTVDRLTCPHLVEHDCYYGYFLPCEFERTVKVEPFLIFGHGVPVSRLVAAIAPRVRAGSNGIASAARLRLPAKRSATRR